MSPSSASSSGTRERLLVVNADDYGYYSCVSRGILEAVAAGAVTATGVLANSALFDSEVERLCAFPSLDVGVHLTLTFGAPLTQGMKGALRRWGGSFPPDKLSVALGVLRRSLPLRTVAQEWDAQLRRCLSAGLRIAFLNTHEHVHVIPSLRTLLTRLADEHGISHVRELRPEWRGTHGFAALTRNAIFSSARFLCRSRSGADEPRLLGVGVSGRLTLRYLEQVLPKLLPGRPYELMCHPGRLDPREIDDPVLLSYHRWEQETAALSSPAFQSLCRENGVRLVGFTELGTIPRSGRTTR